MALFCCLVFGRGVGDFCWFALLCTSMVWFGVFVGAGWEGRSDCVGGSTTTES